MLRLTKLTDYAVVILARMSQEPTTRCTSGHLAAATSLPEATVAKILKDLAKSDLIDSARGSSGGYVLNRSSDAITVRHVIEALEGPINLVECVDDRSTSCASQKNCALRGRWNAVNTAIIDQLDRITLHDMVGPTLVQIAAE